MIATSRGAHYREEKPAVALYYETEYRLGRRVGRISRSYTGVHAFLAIVLDLILGSVLGLVSIVIRLSLRAAVLALHVGLIVLKANWNLLVAIMTALVYCVTLPFALLHHAADRRRSLKKSNGYRSSSMAGLKPEWALSCED
jgi:hypothetical protein